MRESTVVFLHVLWDEARLCFGSTAPAEQDRRRVELFGGAYASMALPAPIAGERLFAYFRREGEAGPRCRVVGRDGSIPIPFTIEGVDSDGRPRGVLDEEVAAIDLFRPPGCRDGVLGIRSDELDKLDELLAARAAIDLRAPGLREQIPTGVRGSLYMEREAFDRFVVGEGHREGVPSPDGVRRRLCRILHAHLKHARRNVDRNRFSFKFRAGGRNGRLRSHVGVHQGRLFTFLTEA